MLTNTGARKPRKGRHPWPTHSATFFVSLFAIAVLLFGGARARAAIELRTIASGLSAPVSVTHASDGSNRLFIVEQAGRIRILAGGSVLSTPFLDIRSQVRSGGELGLLGLAFHPNYRQNGRFFINYTRQTAEGLETVIAGYSALSANADRADPQSGKILLSFRQPFTNHNGGMVAFGPDGFLYIGTGDGGSAGDPQGNGQNLETLLGKILRIDVDFGSPYAIPADNPFAGKPGRDEIWAYGLRNPWRFSFDRRTGRLFAADVGQSRREEIDIIVKGGNYGWNVMEGTLCFNPSTNCSTQGLIPPIHEYGRDQGFSVTGGYVYRGQAVPTLRSKYLFSDFGTGRLWALTEISGGRWRLEVLLQTGLSVSSFGEDESGEVYVVDYSGTVRQVIAGAGPQPAVEQAGVVNAASLQPGPVAPGEIISIFGSEIGPELPAGTRLNSSGQVDTVLAENQVFFDDIPAPLFHAQNDQINAQVPYTVAGTSGTVVQVLRQGVFSNPVSLEAAEAVPGIFTLSGGMGPGAVLNEDLTPNSASNPASTGSMVVLYATGEGQTTPGGTDGKLSDFPFPQPLLPVSVTIAGFPASVVFAGSAPNFAGLLQVNARIPVEAPAGDAVPLRLRIGPFAGQPGVTLAVR
ncbi:MAG: PQQ-dependent sugar dehydrogenase [Acidobacteria bacterium]|nr:PQQ-dependent sugar dehydrogenase [Acidobacteriota bacterium]